MRLGFDFDIVTDNDELIWSSMLVGPDCLLLQRLCQEKPNL